MSYSERRFPPGGTFDIKAWIARFSPVVVVVLSLLIAALLVERLVSDWYINRPAGIANRPRDLAILSVVYLFFVAIFLIFFVKPEWPSDIANKWLRRFKGREGVWELVGEAVIAVFAVLLLVLLFNKSLFEEIPAKAREYGAWAIMVGVLGMLAALAVVVFFRHAGGEVGVRSWINRALIAVVAACLLWLLDRRAVAGHVSDFSRSKYYYDMTKDLLLYTLLIVFVIGWLYELGKHLDSEGGRRALAPSFAAYLVLIFVTVVAFTLVLFFDLRWVNTIEFRPQEIEALTQWTPRQMSYVRAHIIIRDFFIVIPLCAVSIFWAGVHLYKTWQDD
ncbi:MAG: hypothetical protein WEB06_13260 [Actinomycetota bacterium]